MELIPLGHACFKLRSRTATLITDPFDPKSTGLKFPRVEADAVTISQLHPDHNFLGQIDGVPVEISGPGEYEVKGIKVIGISSYHEESQGEENGPNTIYRINMDKIHLVHLGSLGHKLDEKTRELLEDVDVLMLPVGENQTISIAQACEIISQLNPKIVIPMQYFNPNANRDFSSKFAKLELFLKEIGKSDVKPLDKLVITKDKLLEEQQLFVLE